MAADSEPPRKGLLLVGRVGRSHGLRGEVVVDLISDRPERTEPGAEFITDGATLTLDAARPHQRRWLFRFEGHTSREDADAFRGAELWADPLDDSDTLWVHELVGAVVLDGGRERGTVAAVLSNPAADLLELDTGALVPTTFVLGAPESDGDRRIVRIDPPEGLFDL